jgi:predicted flap endonuclease-1-like 5' DNA nuclease
VEFNLTRLPGVTKSIATAMEDAGVKNAQDIMTLGEDGLQSIPGIGPITAEKVYGAVTRLAQVAEQE